MKVRYQYRFYPTNQQQKALAQLFGCVRVVWNDALAFSKSSKYPGYNTLSKSLTLSKKTTEREWLNSVSSVPLQQSLKQLEVAYKNYFDSLKGKRKGKKVGQPRFKKKTNEQSATFTKAAFSIKKGVVFLAKIGNLKPIWSRELPSDPSSVTVIKDCANRYFLSFVVEIKPAQVDAKNRPQLCCSEVASEQAWGRIGVDLGLKTFAVMSDGSKAKSPSYKKLDRKVRSYQKKLARQQKGSNRRNKTRIQVAKHHNRIVAKRKDFLHKLSTRIVSENQTIVLEDLNVSGMVKNRKLARAISLQGWREFRNLSEAKSEKFGREFHIINRWEPTSQICSDCGFKWGKIDLSHRSVLCINCGTEHDRDENAAKNIESSRHRALGDFKRAQRQSKTTPVASVSEALRITAPSGR